MDETYGQLILMRDGGAERAFDLNKTSITLGRDLTNDVVLGDGRVSRNHARLECGPAGCEITLKIMSERAGSLERTLRLE